MNLYEYHYLIKACKVHGNWRPAIVDTTIDGREAYATKDLFIPHPNKPGMWKIYGRADDQIMLSTGEKVCFAVSVQRNLD